ncbi:MAG: hypothetical protein K0U98_13695 [Deltaproteobacteria bacterium]|nr:hypothetical protein [Deltaproteobacteria bacterium]
MKPSTLRETLRAHYDEESLRPETLQRLLSLEGAGRRRKSLGYGWGLAAALLLSLGLLFFWNGMRQNDLAAGIAAEVAMNHAKDLAVEFVATDLSGLRKQMDKLDFTLLESHHLKGRGLRLLGARYCSIQGQLAAQIRLKDGTGSTQTLYQTPLDSSTARLSARRSVAAGIEVQMWQEDGLFMVLAEAERKPEE